MTVQRQGTVICIGCPLGCRVKVSPGKKGGPPVIKGAECRKGEKFVLEEFRNPVRTLTATVPTGDASSPLLPVRSSRPVPKGLLGKIMDETVQAEVKAPVSAGDIIVRNVLETGVDLVATADWPG